MIKRIINIIFKNYYILIIFFGVILFRFLRVKGGALIFDDSFITFRYSSNLADGLGFVYNVGDKVLGTTTPVWTLMLAGTKLLGLDMILAAQILSIIFDICTCCLIFKMLSVNNSSVGKWAALLWMIYPQAVYASTGGMETSLFVFLNTSSFYLISKRIFNPLLRLAAPLAMLVRPEGIIIFAINLFDIYRNDPLRIKSLSLNLVIPVIWVIFALFYFGNPIPFSIIAKRANVVNTSGVFEILSGIFSGETILLLPFMFIGLFYFFKYKQFRHIFIWLIVFIGVYLLGRPKMWVWYYLPMQLGVIIISSFGITFFIKWVSMIFKRWGSQINIGLSVSGMTMIFILSILYYKPSEFGVKNKEFLRFKSLATYVKDNTSSNDTILASDIGYLGYYTNRFILDIWGLVWPSALDFSGTDAQKAVQIAESYAPAAIVIPYKRDFYENAISSNYIRTNYYLDTVFAEGKINILQLDPSFVPETWSARYFVFFHNKDTTYIAN
jgi:hypothetical protein